MIDDQKKAIEFIDNAIVKNNKISHAYLIETNNYADSDKFIKEMIKRILCINKTEEEIKKITIEVDNNSYPDVKYIEPDGYWIKKSQLIELEQEFSKKSMLDNKLIYIINEADKLNDSSANTILKFLEEPESEIVAILVANNRYKVIETILSRCQVISLINSDTDIEISEELEQFITDIFKKKQLIINYNYYLENVFTDKLNAKDAISNIEEVLYLYLNGKKFEYIKCDNKLNIINALAILNKQKEKLDYNVNIKLWLDELIIELIEVK